MTKLHNALMRGKNGEALSLIEAGGVDIDAQDDLGRTALMLALAQGQNRVAQKLLDRDARTDLTDTFNHTALDIAWDSGNEQGRNILFRRLDAGGVQTQMYRAVSMGDVEALAFLVDEMDAPLTAKNSQGKTALEQAEFDTQFDVSAYIEEKVAAFPEEASGKMHKGLRAAVTPMKKIVFRK